MDEMEPAAPSLDDFRDQIVGVLNRTAIDIGSILIAAKHAHPRRFMEWVEAELPFSYPKASQLMAISRAFRDLPPEKRELLPAPWTTMLTLTRLDAERFDQAIEAGLISPDMTRAQALALTGKTEAPEPEPRPWKSGPPKGTVTSKSRLPASLLVRELQRYDPSELTPTQRHELAAWLTGGSDGTTEVDGGRELCGDIA